jgi:hypothetical protein
MTDRYSREDDTGTDNGLPPMAPLARPGRAARAALLSGVNPHSSASTFWTTVSL